MPPRRGGRKPKGRLPSKPPLVARLTRRHWPFLVAVLLVGGGGMLGLALVFPGGSIATPLNTLQGQLLGWTAPLLALWLTAVGVVLLSHHLRPDTGVPWRRAAGALAATLALVALAGLTSYVRPDPAADALAGGGGGQVGLALARLGGDALGLVGSAVLLALLLLVGVVLALEIPPAQLGRAAQWLAFALGRLGRQVARRLRRLRGAPLVTREPGLRQRLAARVRRRRAEREVPALEAAPAESEAPRARARTRAVPAAPAIPPAGPLATPPAPSPWRLPPLSLLELPTSPALAPVDFQQRARIIEETLASFNVSARVVEINQGPTVTQFGIEPAMGVTVSRITARTNDLALRLGATTLRVEAPVPGKRVVGIEVPNSASAVVSLREIVAAPEFDKLKSRLGLALGRDVAGHPVTGDLARMPHLLMAGATGSGKSVCINGIIACLLMQCTPDELQLLMVDPKMVELAPFEGIPHLRLPVVTDMDKVVGVLKWALQEMERRYALFVKHGVRNLETYNRAAASPERPDLKPLPFLVVVIDELADLMMTAPDDVELSLTRLAQKARATGIHLIVATQRPAVDVVTGLIKANFPTRIAFAVTSQVDSRV